MFGLYYLILSCVLFANAVVIINERFLKKIGLSRPESGAPATPMNRIVSLLHGDLRLVFMTPLLFINAVFIVMELLIG